MFDLKLRSQDMKRIQKHIFCLCCMCMCMPHLQPEDWFVLPLWNRFKALRSIPKGFFSFYTIVLLI